ncbi:MAG: acyl-CoA dehydrogenase family protein [Porticoccaceae bacterium]|jgi:alkylation response protein AidB-like acyl-CoA dehydrogenase|nr:pimeloyl-CoA dehydrogenase small subunit [Porticoccaceae bacterium]MDA8978655.1 acyl-CoA dehydrogenase family protein [bacterium]MBT6320054.1 pimeloyl-CoA dehydrogenase small subunit [Porticoccaceae bacterium]MBT7258337.1 pimeloyl-CoA dehydrogenase small subunit [Porticoccaceae bacterium]MBT7905474.1 pimeloyl-CoA dehydrogenase small subunit [Porticoccaceae bacterium]
MNFDFTEEQTMIKDSVSRFVRDEYDFDTRTKIVGSEEGISREFWSMFAELGWLSVPFAEEYGGFGGTVEDIAAVMEELGKGIVVEPYASTVVVFGGLMAASDNAALKSAVIPSIIDGSCMGSLASTEAQSRYEMADVATGATACDGGYKISGEKTVVANGGTANKFIVTARTSGEQFDRDGVSLFLVDADAPGVEVKSYKMMDGQSAATVTFKDVVVAESQLLNAAGEGMDLIDQVMPQILMGLSAEALGIMATLNTTTVEYTKVRQQFDTPISSFQVLQHRMVDTFMACEQTKSMLYRGLCQASEDDSAALLKTVHALKATVARYGRLVGEEAIQIHGGIGMTDELNIGHYVKRLMMINVSFGDGDYHQKKFNQLSYSS